MAGHDIVVIGGSAGGLEALRTVLGGLQPDLTAAVFVALHTAPTVQGVMPRFLSRVSALPVEYAKNESPIRKGQVLIAPPDRHLLVKRRTLRLNCGPKENGFRPAVDPLFRTAAASFGPRVVGIVLSGGMDDGTWGLQLIKDAGGIAMAQDPEEASVPSMPESAIANVDLDFVLRASDMPRKIHELTKGRIPATSGADTEDILESVEGGRRAIDSETLQGPPTAFTCPECGGSLWEFKERKLLRYRCHAGHGYSEGSLRVHHSDGVEAVLWSGLRALEERAILYRRMAARSRERGFQAMARRDQEEADLAEERALAFRKILTSEGLRRSTPVSAGHGRRRRPPVGSRQRQKQPVTSSRGRARRSRSS